MYFESSSGILGKDQILSSAVYDFLTATSDTGELSNDNQAIVVLVLSFCTSLYQARSVSLPSRCWLSRGFSLSHAIAVSPIPSDLSFVVFIVVL